jgi:2-oxoglutarate ferredoxin oxidoreductase subunit alpha
MKKIVAENKGLKIMENTVALGAAMALFDLPFESLHSVIRDIFGGKKGQEIVEENRKAAQAGYDYVKQQQYHLTASEKTKTEDTDKRDLALIAGNESVGMGAIAAGCQFYAAYPMSPSSSLLHYVAAKAGKTGMVVRHAEDEIAVINEVIGASFAGVRTMLGTSGGGFALMVEGVSFAGISESALVIFIAQRPGPATGLPTWQEQGDLQFVIRAGHGEFPKIVLAAGDAMDAFALTVEAFNLADMYQTPVFVLSDKYLAESHMSVPADKMKNYEVKRERGKWVQDGTDAEITTFPRYKDEEDGISARMRPGTKGYYYQLNSYEHSDDGHTTEDAHERVKQVNKRNRKLLTYLARHFQMPKLYGPEQADVTIVAWGTTKLPVMDLFAREGNTIEGKTVNLLHFTHMWPLDGGRVHEELMKHKQLVLIENNSTAQLGQLIRQETGVLIEKRLLKYDGRPIYPDEIKEFIKIV